MLYRDLFFENKTIKLAVIIIIEGIPVKKLLPKVKLLKLDKTETISKITAKTCINFDFLKLEGASGVGISFGAIGGFKGDNGGIGILFSIKNY